MMKRLNIILFLIFITSLFQNCSTTKTITVPVYETRKVPVYGNVIIAGYNKIYKDIFITESGKPYPTPINVVFFGVYNNFIFSDIDTNEQKKFIDFDRFSGFYDKFQPYGQLNLEKIIPFHQKTIHDRAFEKACYNFSDIYFGFYFIKLNNSYIIKIYRFSDGKEVGSLELKDSFNSNVYNDFKQYILYNKAPYYYKKWTITRYEEKRVQVGTREE